MIWNKQPCVNVATTEDVVHIRAFARYASSEPTYIMPLLTKHFLYPFPYVHGLLLVIQVTNKT